MKDIFSAVEKHRQLILDAERYIWKHPETGYREVGTTKYLADIFESLGYSLTMAEGITGFYTEIDTGKPGATVLIMGELDSVICPSHPESDPVTGAVHSCGHNAQCAALVGIAAALHEPGILEKLSGKIILCAVPAEELLEIEYRNGLRAMGKIKYFGGKVEFMHRGYFDRVDVAFMVHTSPKPGFGIVGQSVGSRVKKIIYKGKAAHAGGSPRLGHNALYAATAGINAANALRETFPEEDVIRFHPIITHGGDMVNAIPERVEIETYVRGASFEAIDRENQKINAALTGAALSLGTNIEIIDFPGYAPMIHCREMNAVAEEALKTYLPHLEIRYATGIGGGSTDNGDLCSVMPTIQPYAPGAVGTSHGNDYYITDPALACVENAKFQLALLYMLAENNGARALEIKKNYKPQFASIKEYLAYLDSKEISGDRIRFAEDGSAIVRMD